MLFRIFSRTDRYSLKRNFFLFFMTLFITFLFTGCEQSSVSSGPTSSLSGFYLNTVIKISLYDESNPSLINECFALCAEYETLFSRTDSESALYLLNHSHSKERQLTTELASLIETGLYYYDLSEGRFDITISPLSDLWTFSSDSPVLPASDEIKKAREHVNASLVHIQDSVLLTDDPEIELDLGGLAKGYIADRLKDYLISEGVTSACIDLGGNVLCIGSKPDGSAFRIGIREPFSVQGTSIAIAKIQGLSVVTSGIYERYFIVNDVLYHHILDPSTGYPFRTGLNSVTIISSSSLDGDALSTVCFSLGAEEGKKLIDSLSDIYAVFITEENELIYSDGAESFFLND